MLLKTTIHFALSIFAAYTSAFPAEEEPGVTIDSNRLVNSTMVPQLDALFHQIAAKYNATEGTASKNGALLRAQILSTTSSANLVKYANYAAAAYNVNSSLWTCAIACQTTATAGTVIYYRWENVVKASIGYVAYNDNNKEIVVGYRGSHSFFDLMTNLNFAKSRWPSNVSGSEVHTGFIKAYQATASAVNNATLTLANRYPAYNIVFTGHSLGSSLAAINAADFATKYPALISRIHLYTYGQPRTGNRAFASWVQDKGFSIYRVVFHRDLVPQLPFTIFDYWHHSQEVWYKPSDGIVFCGANGENPDCEYGVFGLSLTSNDHDGYPGIAH
ncbi:alpha/beta-hydrolase [Linderina pennispora]|uniref:Alpha/beta-hydrolase n=1 Tax=Linderina pennispora TaxID=61395 RepID=A0A1Y1VV14_9FUNG|nr:alpha/beta-hydrolase [Linderina pennispora]ORX65122.1 alpha/beta-hydrolase [Linderina pennispora]